MTEVIAVDAERPLDSAPNLHTTYAKELGATHQMDI